jgi:hypothetical protein
MGRGRVRQVEAPIPRRAISAQKCEFRALPIDGPLAATIIYALLTYWVVRTKQENASFFRAELQFGEAQAETTPLKGEVRVHSRAASQLSPEAMAPFGRQNRRLNPWLFALTSVYRPYRSYEEVYHRFCTGVAELL